MTANIVDLFAGPGGWDEGLRLAGRRDVVGVEWDLDACATAEAAGHARVRADVSALDPRDFGPVEGLIASPPCQGFSQAGSRRGYADSRLVLDAVAAVAAGVPVEAALAGVADARSPLVLEPLRWAVSLRPSWLAWEQVPAVLPLWEACGSELADRYGYSTWAGLLHADQFEVGQTRTRAVLLASAAGPVAPPEPVRAHFLPRGLEPPDLPAPRTMFDVLGWGMTSRPYPTVACSSATGGPDKEKVGGSGARATVYAERDAGRWVHGGGCCCPEPSTCGIPGAAGAPFAEPAYRPLPPSKRFDGSVRLSLANAAALQGFPLAYPWSGSPTKQFQQIGNAVPPPLAAHVVRALGAAARALAA